MKKLMFGFIFLYSLCFFSCGDKIGVGGADKDVWYYIYITGDSGRTVNISYLKRPEGIDFPEENITVSDSVTLPFFKEVHAVEKGGGVPDEFLEIESANDSTTKAIIFDNDLKLADSVCRVFFVWNTENAQNECSYCKKLTKDSVLSYLKSINYPCYLEFTKGDTVKKVSLYDWWHKGY